MCVCESSSCGRYERESKEPIVSDNSPHSLTEKGRTSEHAVRLFSYVASGTPLSGLFSVSSPACVPDYIRLHYA
eukprot:scaffold251320_cov27-Tisochrysis_lutea.AAC.1